MKYFSHKYLPIVLFAVGICLIGNSGQAQTLGALFDASEEYQQQTVERGASLKKALELVGEEFGVVFLYRMDVIKGKRVLHDMPLAKDIEQTLKKLLKGQELRFEYINAKTYGIFAKKQPQKIQQVDISGTVTDATTGETLPGVNVIVKGTTTGTATNTDGYFELTVHSLQDTLVVSFIGFQTKEVPINGRTQLNISLKSQAITGQELVVVGYGEQEKQNLTSAVSVVNSEDINSAPVASIANNLTGKLPGLKVMQVSGNPGKYDNQINIRGWQNMLVVVDGVPRPDFQKLDPISIASVSILKDASAAVYGAKSANGVMLIETKEGRPGETKITLSGSYGWQEITGFPQPIRSSIPQLILKNEAALVAGNPLPFPDWEKYTGEDPNYPSVDYWDRTIKDKMPITKNSITVSGGSEDVTYFMNVGNLYQTGLLSNNSIKYKRYNFRSNITAQITNNLSANLIVGGWVDKRTAPYPNVNSQFIRQVWMQPTYEPVYANNTAPFYFNGTADKNPIAVIQPQLSGYRNNHEKKFQSTLSLTEKLPFITKGLEIKGLFSYDFTNNYNKYFRKAYNEYQYNENNDTYIKAAVGSPTQLRQENAQRANVLAQVSLHYTRSFGENGNHKVEALLLGEGKSGSGTSFFGQRNFDLALLDQLNAGLSTNQVANGSDEVVEKRLGLVGRFNYNYQNRYLVRFMFRYDGSSLFPKGKRFGFFPSFSVGWRLSNEPFFNENVSFFDEFKIRFSYGKLGDNSIAKGFQYLVGYNYPSGFYQFNENTITAAATTVGLANPDITWYVAKTMNLGIDATIWNGLVDFKIDLFQRKREGLLANRAVNIPAIFGAQLPQENLNSDLSRGLEVSVGHSNQINNISYDIRANFSYSQVQWLHTESEPYGNSYQKWRYGTENRLKNIKWGYGVVGQFQNQEEIDMAPVQNINGHYQLFPGDIRYEDWNEDGMISSLDQHPIGRGIQPEIYYGLNLSVGWKGISMSVFFQGATNYSMAPLSQLRGPLPWGRNSMAMFLDRWHHQDPLDFSTPWVPGKYPITRENFGFEPNKLPSTFWNKNVWYLRIKNIRLSYSIPNTLLNKMRVRKLQIYVVGTNVYSWKNTVFDPEHRLSGPGSSWGYKYPLLSTYSLGLKVSF